LNAARDDGGGLAGALAPVVRWLLGGELPVRLCAYDGSQAGPPGAPAIVLRSPMALRRLLWSPNQLGLADAYVTGAIDLEGDLTEGFRLLWRPGAGRRRGLAPLDLLRAALVAVGAGAVGRRPPAPAARATLTGRQHSRGRDRAAIAHHYDQSAEFFELLLDQSMAYSCACWAPAVAAGAVAAGAAGAGAVGGPAACGLAEAQHAKLELICTRLAVRPGTRLLDVGCGWGSLVAHAAALRHATVTGVTLSASQAAYCRARLAAAGLPGAGAEIRLADYEEVSDGPYDAIAAIEVGEHIGAARYPAFAAHLRGLLRPGGLLVVQQMSRGPRAPGGGAFIERYVAPDMHMVPVETTLATLNGAGLEILEVQALHEDYVLTIRAWLGRLEARFDEVQAIVGAEVARVWRLYLTGAALAFEDGRMGVDQILATRPAGTP
jgi:cyclopropane-fatty-acyl-phospholipid synthase